MRARTASVPEIASVLKSSATSWTEVGALPKVMVVDDGAENTSVVPLMVASESAPSSTEPRTTAGPALGIGIVST